MTPLILVLFFLVDAIFLAAIGYLLFKLYSMGKQNKPYAPMDERPRILKPYPKSNGKTKPKVNDDKAAFDLERDA